MLTQGEQNALKFFQAGVRTWSITLDQDLYKFALRLESKGLVEFIARYNRRGKPDGHDIVAVAK